MVSSDFNKVLIFDLMGTFGHFRKFYTNSSSLSYSFPPRTTISGLIAGLIGFERDSYYEQFNLENCKIAVSVQTKIRKLMETVNYVSTKNFTFKRMLSGKFERTQIPLEILIPVDSKELRYRVFFCHEDVRLFSILKERLVRGEFVYPPYLGLTEFLGEIDFINEGHLEIVPKSDNYITIKSVVDKKLISKIMVSDDVPLKYYTEKQPVAFKDDRKIIKTATYIFERENNLKAITSGPVYNAVYGGRSENIVFME